MHRTISHLYIKDLEESISYEEIKKMSYTQLKMLAGFMTEDELSKFSDICNLCNMIALNILTQLKSSYIVTNN